MYKHRWFISLIVGIVAGMVSGLMVVPGLLDRFEAKPSTAPPYARLEFTIMDAVSQTPIEADITIRRENENGELTEPERFFTGGRITLELPVDGTSISILVEEEGYRDWELRVRPTTPKSLNDLIKLAPIGTPTVPPKDDVQG